MQRKEADQKGGTQLEDKAKDGGFHHPECQELDFLKLKERGYFIKEE